MKTIGGIGAAGVIGGGLIGSGAAAGASMQISASNVRVANDRGDVSEVRIDPELRVEWENFDDAVGAIYFLVEAKLRDRSRYTPVFRTTPALLPNDRVNGDQFVDYSAPGTTGYFEYTGPLSDAIERAEAVRDEELNPVDDNGGIVLGNEFGRPDYESVEFSSGSLRNYLGGNSVGNTRPQVASQLGEEVLVNGVYGAAFETDSAVDTDTDGETNNTIVDVRYTVELLEPSVAVFDTITGVDPIQVAKERNGTGEATVQEVRDVLNEIYDRQAETWVDSDQLTVENKSYISGLRPSDVSVYGFGDGVISSTFERFSHFPPMNGEEYADVGNTGDGKFAATTRDRTQLRNAADRTPAIMLKESSFRVIAENERASASSSGRSNTGAN